MFFSISFSPPVCLSPSLVVSTICHPPLHQRLGFQNGAFLSAFVPQFKKKKKRHFHIRGEKYESRRICSGMRSGGRRVAICTCLTQEIIGVWPENCRSIITAFFELEPLVFDELGLPGWPPCIVSVKLPDQRLQTCGHSDSVVG